MYPYSEFLQKDLFEKHNLDLSGKIKDDIRLTVYGKILRTLWLDELPQVFDWMRGNLNLFGVRALSEHYFSLFLAEPAAGAAKRCFMIRKGISRQLSLESGSFKHEIS